MTLADAVFVAILSVTLLSCMLLLIGKMLLCELQATLYGITLDLMEYIDRSQEIARLTREISDTDKALARKAAK